MNIKEKNCIEIPVIQQTPEGDYELPSQVLHNLMPFKVREILLVSSLYDAFIIEEEGLISEMVISEYRHLMLSSPPRVTRVTSGKKALEKINEKNYDLVITMSKNIGMDPFNFSKKIKQKCPGIPVVVLATDTADLHTCQKRITEKTIDKAFYWNGDSKLFLAIIKYIEDKINVNYDTKNANVRVLIMLEDSIRYYSMFLPIIYTEIVKQTQRSLSEDLNEMQRLLRRRARVKILLTDNYEEGLKLYEKHKDYALGIISDVNFLNKGKQDPKAGYNFIKYVKKDNKHLPTMLQSSNPENRKRADDLGIFFIYKNSPTLLQDFNHFLLNHLGFGDFIFLLPTKKYKKNETHKKQHDNTKEIASASNLKEFEKVLQKIPLESIHFHANRNDFSNWLMARGEFKLANKLRPQKVTDFKSLDENRKYLIRVFNESRKSRHMGVTTDFSKQKFEFKSSFTKIGGDSLGGKGRGIAFIRSLISRYEFDTRFKNVNITVPNTVVITTEEFDRFIKENNLSVLGDKEKNYSNKFIAQKFLKAKLSNELKKKLRFVLKYFKSSLAVRSSSLLEDSQNHPFAGMYSTYMLPNNAKKIDERLEQLYQAIKLVYASVYFKDAKSYIKSTSSKIEEEKMAIIIQEIVGQDHNGRFYPTFSGIAQSYNFYPVSHQTRDDGIVSLAVGLGHSVVGGEQVLRFCPKYPEILPDLSTPSEIFENSQKKLYVLNTKKSKITLNERDELTLKKLDISDISKDGSLQYLSSTYDQNDGVIRDSFSEKGPYLITFSGILKYNLFPLSDLLKELLKIGKNAMGCPIEIEFAVNLNEKGKNTFAILQIRPLVISKEHQEISWDDEEIDEKTLMMKSDTAMGNIFIENVQDIIYVPPSKFDLTKTMEISREIEILNSNFSEKNKYILIGPGRWGTQDRFLGMPITWNQISNVQIMVETALPDFNITPTQGTHFFQNIISKGVGYVYVPLNKKRGFIDWNWLKKQELVEEKKYVNHIKLKKPLQIKINGKTGKAIFIKP